MGWILKLAWKNMWRNRNRTIITMAAVVFAVMLSVITSSLQDGIFGNLVKNVVSFYTGYIQVHKEGYWDEQILDNSLESSERTEQAILKEPNITDVTPRLESFALISSDEVTRGGLVVGIDPVKEDKVTALKAKLRAGSYLSRNENAVIIAEGLAGRLNLHTGDTIVLIGQGYHGATAGGKYPVKGIVKFGSPELNEKTVFMPLRTAQDLFSADGMITSYVLSLRNTKELEKTATASRSILGAGYEVMTWGQIMPDIKQHIDTDSGNMGYIQGVLYMLICFGIFGTLVMMMVERKFELGMLVAVGMKKTKMIGMFICESVFTVAGGCIIGILVSIPLVYYLNRHPLKMGGETARIYERFGFEAIFPASVDASNFITQGVVVLVIGLLLSLYPVYKVIRLNPVTAMKR